MYNPNYPNPYGANWQQQPTTTTFAWILGEAAASAYPVAPGNTVVLMDTEKPILYMKSADINGRPQPMQIRYLVTEEQFNKIQNGIEDANFNLESYVTKEEFQSYIEEANKKFIIKEHVKLMMKTNPLQLRKNVDALKYTSDTAIAQSSVYEL